MPHFILTCRDKADALDLRLATRPAHAAYIAERLDIVKLAGPLLNEDGQMIGSLIIFDVDDRAQVQAFADNDPYTKAGVFESVSIDGYTVVRGALA